MSIPDKFQCRLDILKKKILFIYLFFRERGREGEREGEKHPCVVVSCAAPTGDLACNLGMCPDWESNRRPFGLQAVTQPTEPHQPGLDILYDPALPLGTHARTLWMFLE